MAIEELSAAQIEQLVGTRDAATGMEYPASGLQPYYLWLVRTLHNLAQASAGACRVVKDDADATTVRIIPGRASISGAVLDYAGGAVELGSYNNDTAYLWLYDDSNGGAIGAGGSADGWPAAAHIKLAEVTLSGGAVTSILDRRFETILKA